MKMKHEAKLPRCDIFKVDKECSGSYLNKQYPKARMVISHAGFIF
jgi:hypothetical protein